MTLFETIILCACIAGIVAFLGYELHQENKRHKAWLAERKAQTDLYKALLYELHKAK